MGDSNAAALKGWVQRTIAEMLLMEVGWCTYICKYVYLHRRARMCRAEASFTLATSNHSTHGTYIHFGVDDHQSDWSD